MRARCEASLTIDLIKGLSTTRPPCRPFPFSGRPTCARSPLDRNGSRRSAAQCRRNPPDSPLQITLTGYIRSAGKPSAHRSRVATPLVHLAVVAAELHLHLILAADDASKLRRQPAQLLIEVIAGDRSRNGNDPNPVAELEVLAGDDRAASMTRARAMTDCAGLHSVAAVSGAAERGACRRLRWPRAGQDSSVGWLHTRIGMQQTFHFYSRFRTGTS